MKGISVVIPTYNRNEQLSNVLDKLLASDVAGLDLVEVIVVDDGSPIPAEGVLSDKSVEAPFRLTYVRQENAGPGEARNNGLRSAANDLVLFIDDDVLVLPDVIMEHVQAHSIHPGSVIHGPYPYLPAARETPEFTYLRSLLPDPPTNKDLRSFIPINTVASGNLSVMRSVVGDSLYESDLETPVAEEYALNARLSRDGIPVFLAEHIQAWHLQPPTLTAKCVQEYKYGVGSAEVVIKRPGSVKFEPLKTISREHAPNGDDGRSLRKSVRDLLTHPAPRKILLWASGLAGHFLPIKFVTYSLFRLTIGLHFAAGFKEGFRRFGGSVDNR